MAGNMLQERGQINLREILSTTCVQNLDITQVPLLDRELSINAAAAAMRQMRQGSALVCEGEQLVGIVTERDVLRAVGATHRMEDSLDTLMTTRPKTVALDDTLSDVVSWMDRGGYRRLPVVDAQGRPAGVIDVTTVVNYLVEHMPAVVYNQASRRTLIVQECEGA
jgi:CBS domain-containing protein